MQDDKTRFPKPLQWFSITPTAIPSPKPPIQTQFDFLIIFKLSRTSYFPIH
ncbi:hypothetical protein C943_03063 [Mariniradius saccharolyticus AK6]|uniref:Uncharacterized protein n=1 Tax=Mariniradius saccharolyticus AK6 TaxID=1239962 RepID=M7XCL3_9BACT|nr:hypothetical protein C943_03063 [Mariniradius saccharolyticus AK6]